MPLMLKVSLAYVVCSIFQKCIGLITLPLFAKHLLTTEQYGQCTIYSSWMGIIGIFVSLNLPYGSFSPAMIKFEGRRDEYISSIQGICLLLSGAFLLVYLPFRNYWNQLFELPTFIVCLMIIEIIAQTAVQLWSGKKRFEYKYKSVVALTLLSSVLGPAIAYICVIMSEEKGLARIVGSSIVSISVGLSVFLINLKRGKKLYNKEFWKYAFGFNIPLLVYYLSQIIFNQSDRIMISHITGTSDAALYGVAYSLATILTFVLNAINNSYIPWLYEIIRDKRGEENKKTSLGIAVLMALMILFIIWFAPEIILLMAGEKYAMAVNVVAPIAMSLLLLFYSQLFINVEFYYEEKKKLVWASIGAAIINILLNAWLIPIFGFVAAGYTTLLSYLLFAFSNYLAMKKIIKKRELEDVLYNYKGLLIVLTLFILCGFIGVFLYGTLLVRLLVTLAVLIIVILCRKPIINSIRFINFKH